MKKILNNKLLVIYSLIEGFLLVYGSLLDSDMSISNFNAMYIFITIIMSIIFYIFNNLYFKALNVDYKEN